MLPLLRSRNMVSFVIGTNKCPPAFLKDDEGKIIDEVNPEFDAWVQQDAMVLSWINSSVHPTLMNTHRGDSTIVEFLDRIHFLADTLPFSGFLISDSDLVAIILNNVGLAHESTIASAQARAEAITYSALEALLLGAERHQKLHTVFENGPTAFTAGRGLSGPYRGRGVFRGGRGHFNGGVVSLFLALWVKASLLIHPDLLMMVFSHPSPTQNGGRIQY
ncbi:hypothetical protein D8674_020858 [Pyrus ussuriensis x Pyrus communis]|uniref:Uncharacterized protein n=1 Tax=Pyrus ussuriensis x Pyrus communis TaxID=2448454 RepID=A0A5N5HNY2_9ROSA|nr:hypothetical protein D8674_020858 [Pyrus ussuriensis x Pyrus communis]